jgi:glycosyltransferase involved in cell wall biosynthesis
VRKDFAPDIELFDYEYSEYAMKDEIIIWQYSIEHLTFSTCLWIQKLSNNSISFIIGSQENEIRKEQGWLSVDLSALKITMIESSELRKKGIQILRENKTAIHIFQGFRGAKRYNYFPLILYALRHGIKIAVLNEPYSLSPTGYFSDENPLLSYFKVLMRPLLYRGMAILFKVFAKNNPPCIMPLSLIAKQQLVDSGFDKESLYPFGYFVPKDEVGQDYIDQDNIFKIIFVGAMLKRKGFDILQKAVLEIKERGFNLISDIYGAGNFASIENPKLGIYYKGVKPFFEIQATIAKYDALVLPSRHDGWGVVVNEALMQGIPAIVSDRVGAKCLLENGDCGLVFKNNDPIDLASKIILLIENRDLHNKLKLNARKVGDEISPQKAAQYYIDTLEYHFYKRGNRPKSIWCNRDGLESNRYCKF